MSKYDIISIGGATVDIFVQPCKSQVLRLSSDCIDECQSLICFDYGGKLKVEDVHETYGGGAANTSIGFHRLGLKSAVVTLVGNDEWGNKVLENLEREGVSRDFVGKTRTHKSSFSVIINSFEGERTVLFYPGANKRLKKTNVITKDLKNTKWIFINRVASEDDDILKHLEKFLKENPKIKVAWNPGGSQISEGFKKYKTLLKRVEIIFLNKEEAAAFSGISFAKQNNRNRCLYCGKSGSSDHNKENCLPDYAYDCRKIFKKLHSLGIKNVVITDGKRGAQVYDGKDLYFCPIVSDKRVDTLGAGDSFCTGFTYGYLQSLSLQVSLKFATINATSVVNFYGAQAGLLNKRQLQDLYEKNKLKTSKIHITKK